MANKKQTLVALTLIAVGASGLFGLRALGAPGPSVPPLTSAVAAPAVATVANQAVDPALKDQMREMLKDRMGLTGPEADKLIDGMAEHMQAIHGDQAGAMLDQCEAQSGTGPAGGMMGGAAGGMMGGGI